ncbi:GDSL-type esterase/lipase family protein [Pseudalkalibacillus sp. A8]|uniref:GDSL-type esterase/lipase family protein n=1 Tax=Pseudalkalibacillus sp. A8 TaxID=3382641 RepID=UPI0038B48A31
MDENKLRYTALGDSLTAGVGTLFSPGFVSRYSESLEGASNRKVIRTVFARNGATTKQILDFLSKDNVRDAVFNADVITITAGGNDLKKAARTYFITNDQNVFPTVIKKIMKNIAMLIQQIYNIKEDSDMPYIIRLVGLYNPFPFLSYSDTWIKTFNHRLERFQSDNLKVANIYEAFKKGGGNVLSIDGMHPNGYGYKIIADELASLGYDPLLRRNKKKFLFSIFD